jgi:hypothetical protein
MKALCILLALLNVVFLVWQLSRSDPTPASTLPAPADKTKRIILLKELDAELANTQSGQDSDPPPVQSAP